LSRSAGFHALTVGIAGNLVDQPADLVHRSAIGLGPRAPLLAINRTQLAAPVRPFIPDRHAIGLEIGNIGVARQKPQQFVDDGFQVQFLGGDKRKPLGQIKPHLMPEHRQSAGTGAVGLAGALVQNAAQKIMIGKHGDPILP
jgi:hypothetical protein